MGRRLLITALTALCLVAPAGAETRSLWPGVTFERGVQFTPNGPVALNVLTGPRPDGTTTLAPVLSNGTIVGRETITSMQRRMTPSATTAGVNGDFFTFATGAPSGVFMRDAEVVAQPYGDRSSAGLTADGALDVRRIAFFGTWRGSGPARPLGNLNRPPAVAGGAALFTPAYGAAVPVAAGSVAVTLFPFPLAVPNTDLDAAVVDVRRSGGAVPIPRGGAVLVARGTAASELADEGSVGSLVRTQLLFRPAWPGIVSAIGGGPQIVRDGAPVFRAGEAFTSTTLGPREPRTAVGQLRDGRLVLVAVDGRQPGYSVGMTNFELAQALVRLGAVTAMALDGGGSTAMAFDGKLLSRPSTRVPRPVSTALMFEYVGAFVEPPHPVVSPNGDGVDDGQLLRYRLVRPSSVTVTLTRPDGSVAYSDSGERAPGAAVVPFPPPPAPVGPVTAAAGRAGTAAAGTADDVAAEGTWTLSVAAVDDTGQASAMQQTFVVNSTVGFLRTSPAQLLLPPSGRTIEVGWQQSRPAVVTLTVEQKGTVARRVARRLFGAGDHVVRWNGLLAKRQRLRSGSYVVRLVARNELGAAELTRKIRVQRVAGAR